MVTAKKENKISQTRASEEAAALIEQLMNSKDAGSIGSQLNQQYSMSPRREILTELQKQLADSAKGIDRHALTSFLKTQTDGVKNQDLDRFVKVLLRLAISNGDDDLGAKCASDIVVWQIHEDRKVPRITTFKELPGAFTVAFEELCSKDEPQKVHFKRWVQFSQPCLNCTEKEELRFSRPQSSRVLDSAAALKTTAIPEAFYSIAPSLIFIAQEGSGLFLASENGKAFIPHFRQLGNATNADAAGTADLVPPPKERLKAMMKDVESLFEQLQADHLLREDELIENEIKQQNRARRLGEEIEELKSAIRKLKLEQESQLKQKESEISSLDAAKSEVEKAAKQLDADLKLTDANAEKELVDQKSDLKSRIGQAIDGPVSSLVDDITAAISADPDSDHIQNIAISFDSLHRKLIRETDLKSTARVPLEDD